MAIRKPECDLEQMKTDDILDYGSMSLPENFDAEMAERKRR